ncbi:efflux RND transporter permease subunit [Brevundimonas intermedia]|uniref:efflux RND transporter permease subunit n=1 Tax=Brevundimonas intermedia TaxID=74315 RepID=UPI003207E59B
MTLGISAWAIRNPIPVAVLFVALIVAGIGAYLQLPVKSVPDTAFAAVQVSISQSGAAPAELESQVTRLAENAVAGLPGVNHVMSTVAQGRSITTVEFEIGEDVQKATDQVRTAIDRIRASLPRTIDEPIIERLEADSQPILTYAVSAPAMSASDLSWYIDDALTTRLQSIGGIASIARVGGVDREINVTLYPDRLAAYGLTAPAVSAALRAFAADGPGGRAELGGGEQTIRVLGAARDLNALRAMTLPTGAGRSVRLADVADIGAGESEARSFARLNGRPVVGFQITKTRAASDVGVEDAVHREIAEIARTTPGVTITEIVSTVGDTRASFHATVAVLLEGMALAAVVVFLFLRSWRSTLIAALAMPISLIPTFAVMALLGFSLNIVTLLGLTLVVGILVDDAIVEIENIEKRIERGETPYQAALLGADQIGLAVVACALAIVVVFVPVSLMGGAAGQYFREFGLTVAAAVLFSLLVARLLTPLLAAWFLKPVARPHPPKPFKGPYRKALDWALAHPGLSLLLGALVFAGSLGLATRLPTGFIPVGNPTSIALDIQASPGATHADMDDTVAQVTRLLRRQPDVRTVFATVGGEDLSSGSVTVAFQEARTLTATQFKDRIRPLLKSIPDVRVTLQGERGPADVEITLVGREDVALAEAAERVQQEMRSLPQLTNIRLAAPPAGPELIIRPRTEEAARLGVTAETLAEITRVATIGDIDANVARMTEGERRVPIRAQLAGSARRDLTTLADLQVPTVGAGTTRLGAVADLGFEAGPARIERFDRERRVSIHSDLRDASIGQALAAVEALPAMTALPNGVRNAAYGDAEQLGELFGGFATAMAAGVALIFAVLVLLFHSLFKPVTILTALPLSIVGAISGLFVFGFGLTLPALIGFLMLLGLAAKNSILLVEFAIEREREGMSQHDALIAACRERARPIVMTTVAMAAGMVPTAIGLGEGAAFRQPMAVAVIGGLITSTLLSLLLVPVVYRYVDRFELWLKPRLARVLTPRSIDTDMER